MKILLTMNLPYTRIFGGANKSNKSLAEEFAKKGHDVLVVAPALATPSHITHDELLEELSASGIHVEQVEGYYQFEIEGVKINAVINASQLRNKLIQKTLQYNPDWVLISAEDPSQTLLNAAFEAAPEKVVYLAHTPQMFPFGSESMYPGEKRTQVIGKSRLIVTISDFVADYIRDNTGFDVLVNHPPHFGAGAYPTLSDFNKGYVLTMNPCGVKGISIFTSLAKIFPEIPFAYVPGWGTTPSDIQVLDAIPNITRLKNEPDLNDLLKQAKIMLMPTLWSEGFGMATVDAMLRGIPVLASNFGGLKEAKLGTDYSVVIHPIKGFTGELDENSLPVAMIPEQPIELWENALKEVYFDEEMYQKQSQVAYDRAHEFINTLSIDKLENWLTSHLPYSTKEAKPKIDIKNLTPEQKKKLLLEMQKKKAEKQEKLRIKPIAKVDSYELSYAQKRLWILDQINEGYYGYIIPSSLVLKGDLNKNVLHRAFEHVIGKHESLRTYFITENGTPRQKILDHFDFQIEEHDFSIAEDSIEIVQIFAKAFGKIRFNLTEAPLLRVALVKVSSDEHILLFAMHHIISDGWSMKVLTREVYSSYYQLSQGAELIGENLEIHYKDYSAWQDNLIESEDNSNLKAYWFRKLGGELTVLNLPTDKPRPALKTYNGKIIQKTVSEDVSARIQEFCSEQKISLFAYLTATVKVLLHRYTDQNDIIVGTPTAGRTNSQLENQIGFYVNMLALRDELNPSESLTELLVKINNTIIEALDHETYPYDKIVEDLNQNRDLSRSPLFDVMVSLEDTTDNSQQTSGGSDVKSSGFDTEEDEIGSSHDLAFIFYRNGNHLSVNLVYNTDLFEDWKGQLMLNHICNLVLQIAVNSTQKLKEIDYLTVDEKKFILNNEEVVSWPENKLIHQLFEDIVSQYSNCEALSFEEITTSYDQLNKKANQLAHYLREQGVGRNTIVALLVERSNEMLVSILAVLKAGGTYLPIDPNYPQDRINYTLENSKCGSVVTDNSYDLTSTFSGQIISLNDELIDSYSDDNLPYINEPEDIAYIIYTSGSTGWPKGVMISHYNVVRLLFNDAFQFDFSEKDVWTLFHSYCFDFSVWEMYGALLYGGKLVVVPKLTAQSPREFWNLVNEEKVTVLNQTPGAFYNLIEEAKTYTVPTTNMRYVIFGGEALNPKKLQFWHQQYPSTKLINMYGITETTVHVTFKEISKHEIENGISNIGKPIPTLKTYILDKHQNLLPVGVAGELCVGGLGLALGYLNNSELTKTKFINHPFVEGEKLYRSGDLAKLLPNGEMEYLGRIDFQVKIRGFRIELGEIESKLTTYKSIEDCLVLVKKDENDDNFLVAYYISEDPIEVKDLREYLGKNLPDYMIPAFFVHYKSFPLNQNGKVDRKVLIDPLSELGNVVQREITLPQTETEILLASLWNEVLKKSESGIDDNFFEIGGHSLKANQLIGKIYNAFQVEIRLGDFFDSPSIRELAVIVDSRKKDTKSPLIPIEKQEVYEMSFAQKRMWVLEQMNSSGTAYTMPMGFEISGNLEIDRLEKAINSLINRHESLRTTFKIQEGIPVQFIHEKVKPLKINVQKVSEEEINEHIEKNATYRFSLDELYLLKLELLQINEQKHILLFNMHHIISDAHSIGVLFGELFRLYAGKHELSDLMIQYRDFSYWQNAQLESQETSSLKNYWLQKLSGKIENHELPTDFKRPEERSFRGANQSFELGEELSSYLTETAQKHNTTLFVVALSILKVFLQKITNQRDIVVGSPVSGRIHPKLESQIGFYVNTLAFRDEIDPASNFETVIKQVKQTVEHGLKNQAYPFDLLVEELNIERDLSRNPLFDVMISMDEENTDLNSSFNQLLEGIQISSLNADYVSAKFDLTFGFHRRQNSKSIGVSINYNTDIFAEETINKFEKWFTHLTTVITKEQNPVLTSVSVLSQDERNRLLHQLNDTKLDYNVDLSVLEQIRQVVEQQPEKMALKDDFKELNYRQVWDKSDALANFLHENGIGLGKVVPVLLNRSVETVISILSILKTGAAYVFVDPAYPADRIAFMLEDCESSLLITETDVSKQINFDQELILVDQFNFDEKKSFELCSLKKNDLAYLIYTSGSTGLPKGVMITHNNLNAFIAWSKEAFKNTDVETVYNATSYSFDLSIFEIFYSLSNGKTIRVVKDGLHIQNYLPLDQKIMLNTVPSVVKQMITQNSRFENVVAINIAGEPIPQIVKNKLDFDRIEVRNLYGPSEDTTYSTCYRFSNEDFIQNIGKPIANTQAFILDSNGELLPEGIAGELCLSGDCIALGYLNRGELTNEKFIENPFGGVNKLYKTGDLVRWLKTGELEYLGRIDKQIKIRGFRIELEEIEKALAKHPDVVDVAVADLWNQNTEEKYLAAYYVSRSGTKIENTGAFLADFLPAYMIPSHFTLMDKIPVSPNGKTDRSKLPNPMEALSGFQVEIKLPVTALEKELCTLWQTVLGLETVGTNLNFFEIGGQSLKAALVVNEIQSKFDSSFTITDVFRHSTVERMVSRIEKGTKERKEQINKSEEKSSYPLSSAQRRLFMISQFDGIGTTYNMPGAIRLKGRLNLEKFENALQNLVQRHESLRTTFKLENETPVQFIENHTLKLESDSCTKDRVYEKLNEFVRPFDLSTAPLFRVKLLTVSDEEYVLLYDIHHIIGDGVSLELIIRDLFAIYNGENLSELRIQYKDYAVWQQSRQLEQQKQFWLDVYAEEIPQLNLPTDFKRSESLQFEGGHTRFVLTKEQSEKLKSLAAENGSTLFMLLFSAYGLMLSKLTGRQKVVIGTPVAGRNHKDLENVVGMFVNNLAIPLDMDSKQPVNEFLLNSNKRIIEAFENQDYQFEDLVNALELPREIGRNPLFDTMFTFQSKSLANNAINTELEIEPLGAEITTSKFDLTLAASEYGDELVFSFEFAKKLFTEATIQKFGTIYSSVISQILEGKNITEISILTSEDKQRIKNFNATRHEVWPTNTLIDGFKLQVSLNPEKNAVNDDEKQLTYEQLDKESDKIACSLVEKGIQKGDVVAVLLPRSVDAISTKLGIMKSGACYLPIDVSHPQERIRFYIDDSEAKFTVTSEEFITLVTNGIIGNELKSSEDSVLLDLPSPSDHAYMIYTSGSTGLPKGVKIKHEPIVNTIYSQIELFGITPNDVYLQFASPSFDASITDIYGALLAGARLAIPSENSKTDIHLLTEYCNKEGVTIALLPPVLSAIMDESNFTSLKTLVSGGEALKPVDAMRLSKQFNLFNAYGPTEAAVCCSVYPVESNFSGSVPIGTPLANTEIYILDSNLQQVPVGSEGEICIAGIGVSDAYHKRDELSGEKFIQNKFSEYPVLYRTGDLGKINTENQLEYLGRIDNQVKIRGYRIELGEIESQLQTLPGIESAVVVIIGDSDKRIVAYCVSSKKLDHKEISTLLSEKLPSYMLPDLLIEMDEIPLTVNGKVNFKKLPTPQLTGSTELISPINETQQIIFECWKEVLGIGDFGITDNFFQLGGNSILAMKVVSRLTMDFEIRVNQLFENPTIESLEKVITYHPQHVEKKLQQLKSLVEFQTSTHGIIESTKIGYLRNKLTDYQRTFEKPILKSKQPEHILITGALGFMGMHLVDELLHETNAKLYLLVRSQENKSCETRFSEKAAFYFGSEQKFENFKDRIMLVEGDITRKGLFETTDSDLNLIDCIIHTASNTSHFGNWSDFEKTNIHGTQNIIDFAQKVNASIHYISTLSVAGGITEDEYVFFSENDIPDNIENKNYYINSKIEAEKLLHSYTNKVNVSIYRVGNLMPSFKSGIFQENAGDNAFMNTLKFYFELGKIPAFKPKIYDFSFIDEVSKAIRLLISVEAGNYHLSNPNKVNDIQLGRLIASYWEDFKVVEVSDLIDEFIAGIDQEYYSRALQSYISNSKVLESEGGLTKFHVASEKTNQVLKELGYSWKKLNPEYMGKMLKHLEKSNFIKRQQKTYS